VDQVGHFLSDAIDLFLSTTEFHYSEDGFEAYGGFAKWFKLHLAERYAFAGKFLAPIVGALDHYGSDPTPASFYPVYQFLAFMTHLSLLDLNQVEELEEGYLQQEELLAQQDIPFRVGSESEPDHARVACVDRIGCISTYWCFHLDADRQLWTQVAECDRNPGSCERFRCGASW
jgi:hypothetical protein